MGRPLRIAILVPEFPGQTHVLFWREVIELRARGHDVHLVSTRRPKKPSPHLFSDVNCTYLWPPDLSVFSKKTLRLTLRQLGFVWRLPEGGAREKLYSLALIPSALKLAAWLNENKFDHIHIHSFARSALLGALASLDGVCGYSVVLHGGIENYGMNHRAKIAGARFVGSVSELTRKQLVALDSTKTIVDLPCGVPFDVFKFVPKQPLQEIRFVSVSRLHEGKGIQFFLQALAHIKQEIDFSYSIVGDGEFENQLRALVHDLGLTDRVRFLGSLAETQVARVLVEHDVMVLASFGSFETTAIAVREAMAVGLPVIMSRVGEAENMIEPYGNGILVGQKNIDDLVAAIRWFSMHRDDIPRMGLKSFEKARLEYASDRSPVRLISAIQESLHNG